MRLLHNRPAGTAVTTRRLVNEPSVPHNRIPAPQTEINKSIPTAAQTNDVPVFTKLLNSNPVPTDSTAAQTHITSNWHTAPAIAKPDFASSVGHGGAERFNNQSLVRSSRSNANSIAVEPITKNAVG